VVHSESGEILKAHKVIVTLGEQKASMIAINSKDNKIKVGDQVVVQGNERLRPDINVEIVE